MRLISPCLKAEALRRFLVRLAKRIQEHNRLNPYYPEDEEKAEKVIYEDNDESTKFKVTIRYNDQPEEQEEPETEMTAKWIKHELCDNPCFFITKAGVL